MRRLETDRNRVLRMMESRSQDLILPDGPGRWRMVTRWTGWSEMPVMEFHHGRSTPGGETLTTQQPDKTVCSVVPDTSIRIGPVIDEVLLEGKPVMLTHDGRSTSGGKTCAGQQPDKVVGTNPMGARHPIVNTPNTRAPGHEVELLPGGLGTSGNSRNSRTATDQHLQQGALLGSLGARHPMNKPTTRVTNHFTWPVNMIGLVGWRGRSCLGGSTPGC